MKRFPLKTKNMKEQDFINIIKKQIGSEFIGDDCAYLKELGIVITQDSLVEDVHFKLNWCTPYQLGYKAVTVNISDILASGARPAYITIALSLPSKTSPKFIDEFYKGANSALRGAKIVGGDITGADKVYISITAIGTTQGRKISSRSHAKIGDVVITKGKFGQSSAGLQELMNNGNNTELINAHLEPQLEEKFAYEIATQIQVDYAMMDTSDGLAEALFQIAKASDISINSKYVEGIFGAEDYKLVATVPKDFLPNISEYKILGEVIAKQDYVIKIGDKKYYNYNELDLYNHFGEEQ